MKVKNVIYEDYINYKRPAMFIASPMCDFKCCPEEHKLCHNNPLINGKTIEVDTEELVNKFLHNKLTEAVIFSGLEPLYDNETISEMKEFIRLLREKEDTKHMVVIYTGYTEDEAKEKNSDLFNNPLYRPMVVKFGRFKVNEVSYFNDVLGVTLSSSNQYAIEFK